MTTKINLLPWRELRRKKERTKIIQFSISTSFIALLTCFLMNYTISILGKRQENCNQLLRNEINKVDAKISEINKIKIQIKIMAGRMLHLQELRNRGFLAVHLFAELPGLIPEGVYINLLRVSGKKIILRGFSETSFALSKLMKNIEQNAWMQSVKLIEIKKENRLDAPHRFTLSFFLQPNEILKK
ncbi:MAG: PilN domain-containing protein [Tatlockia sp.]|nr:PilN domain-containing protein [Tatlockia sp.]